MQEFEIIPFPNGCFKPGLIEITLFVLEDIILKRLSGQWSHLYCAGLYFSQDRIYIYIYNFTSGKNLDDLLYKFIFLRNFV